MALRVIIFIFGFLFIFNLNSSEKIKISTGPVNHPTVRITTSIIKEAYSRLDIKTEFIYSSWGRSLEISNNGESDAELCRKAKMNKKYPNLVMVKIPLINLSIMAFSKNQKLEIKSWENLSEYRITFLRGIKRIEEKTAGYNTHPMNKLEDSFRLLENNRVDIVVVDHFNGLKTIKKMGLENIYALDEPLEESSLYHYLHIKHEKLLPKLEEILLEMTQDGTIDKIIHQSSL